MNTIVARVSHDECTGCSACANACPTDALYMEPNEDGFIVPILDVSLCISCGKCIQSCPVLQPRYLNNSEPECYAFRADDTIRKQSSSGGAFTILAENMLADGGKICGAVLNPDLGVKHVMAHERDDILPMRDSKYVQSNIGFVYREIRECLENGDNILFTGTPCQIAGLTAFLGRYYSNLYTVDLICHGVPSWLAFRKYLDEVGGSRKIASVKFRDKRYGWSPDHATLRIDYVDGGVYEGDSTNDPFIRGFRNNLLLRHSCYNCPYCDYPRQGDLTLGDFWWYEFLEGGDNDQKGTSLVMVNNEKGSTLLEWLQTDRTWCKRNFTPPRKLPNRISSVSNPHPARNRFLHLSKRYPFLQAASYCLDDHYDVGIVGPVRNQNIGGFLTYFALYHVISDMGYTAQLIDCPSSSEWGHHTHLDSFADAPVYDSYAMAEQCATHGELTQLNNRIDQFVVGSDQVFNPELYKYWGKFTNLDWVNDDKKKLAFASSFGFDYLKGDENDRMELSYFLKKFDALAVREKSGVKICAEQFGLHADHVLDPVFLCDPSHYNEIISKASKCNNNCDAFLHAYIYTPTEDKEKIIEYICKQKNIPYRLYTDHSKDHQFHLAVSSERLNGRLRDMRDCAFSITDSFHGLCFAIIFRKDFIVMPNANWAYARYISILRDVGLEDHLVHDWNEFDERKSQLMTSIDYSTVIARLDVLAERSRSWLQSQLGRKIQKTVSEYNIVRRLVDELERKYEEKLTTQAHSLRAALTEDQEKNKEFLFNILNRIGKAYTDISHMGNYLEHLTRQKEEITILIAARDTPADVLPEEILVGLRNLGCTINLNEHFRHAYYAIISGGTVLQEKVGTDRENLNCEMNIGHNQIILHSSPFESGCQAKIIIDGRDLAVNRRGLNFVVLDKQTGCPLDSVCFDTFLPEIPAFRR